MGSGRINGFPTVRTVVCAGSGPSGIPLQLRFHDAFLASKSPRGTGKSHGCQRARVLIPADLGNLGCSTLPTRKARRLLSNAVQGGDRTSLTPIDPTNCRIDCRSHGPSLQTAGRSPLAGCGVRKPPQVAEKQHHTPRTSRTTPSLAQRSAGAARRPANSRPPAAGT